MTNINAMRFPTLTLILIVVVIWLSYELHKHPLNDMDLLEKERQANLTRKKPLDDLYYITIPLNSLPFFSGIDEKIEDIQNQIKILATKKIVNLTHFSNTELKLKYGAANLSVLMEYDKNFLLLARLLYQWGNRLNELSLIEEAICVLEFGISIETDVKGNYQLLLNLYQQRGLTERIPNLIKAANNLPDSLMKQTILSLFSQDAHF